MSIERSGAVQPSEEKAQGDLVHVCKCPMQGSKEDGGKLSSLVTSERQETMGTGQNTENLYEHKKKFPFGLFLVLFLVLFYCESI